MKKISIIILAMLVSSAGFSQQILKWSIGEAKVSCGEVVKASYSLYVSIDDQKNSPALGSSTMRLFYDAGVLNNFTIQNTQNGYYVTGLHKSNPVLGDIFGFSNEEGVFVQFDLMDNARSNPLLLSTKPRRVLDFSFDIDSDAKYPLCTPIVLDNNPDGWLKGIAHDDGYIPGSAGIVGSYFLNQDYTKPLDADDEVINLSWKKSNGPIGKIKKGKKIGQINKSLCIKKNICKGPDKGRSVDNNAAHSESETFNVFPVPFFQSVFVEYSFDYDTKVILEIFDAEGVLITRIENQEYVKDMLVKQPIDLSTTNAQMLFVRLTTNKSSETLKIVSMPVNQ